jgi:catechol 2,3-dioxygenase-like lactoylglutathione lyase family enzyme
MRVREKHAGLFTAERWNLVVEGSVEVGSKPAPLKTKGAAPWWLALAFIVGMMVLPSWGQSAEKPKILGLRMVEIGVSNPRAADNFYGKLNSLMGPCPICGWHKKWALLPNGQEIGSSTTAPGVKPNFIKYIGFEINDVQAMARFLKAMRVPFQMELPIDGDGYLIVTDPEGHEIRFIEFGRSYSWLSIESEIKKAAPSPIRLIHAGFVVNDRAAMDHFYKDILGFHLYWQGGMKDGETDWVCMQVPDGTDRIEYMLNVPAGTDKRELGVMNHIALGVSDIHMAAKALEASGMRLTEKPEIGRDGKWQLNLYDPDGTRVELMEFLPVEKPCCSEFTGTQPKP